ncbi:hypothetical protein KQ940_11820 [Marinobacterium sp. D7]|uniref:hypothetical protein n=1 Tax=Marinobacterium ramblicola TaxID=2849041 RepID=UPI001C2CDE54|nr:hypothetical protein [Marinobacterium ramblicola]MBV1788742.1 hypothetical protein [Marinobacterium ramblicola]
MEALVPLQEELPPIPPPARVWASINHRIQPARQASLPFWQRVWPWRLAAVMTTGCALLLALWIYVRPAQEALPTFIAPLRYQNGEVVLIVSGFQSEQVGWSRLVAQWSDMDGQDTTRMLYLWGQIGEGESPQFLGRIVSSDTELSVPPERWHVLKETKRFLVSVDNRQPTPDTALYRGPCRRLYTDSIASSF